MKREEIIKIMGLLETTSNNCLSNKRIVEFLIKDFLPRYKYIEAFKAIEKIKYKNDFGIYDFIAATILASYTKEDFNKIEKLHERFTKYFDKKFNNPAPDIKFNDEENCFMEVTYYDEKEVYPQNRFYPTTEDIKEMCNGDKVLMEYFEVDKKEKPDRFELYALDEIHRWGRFSSFLTFYAHCEGYLQEINCYKEKRLDYLNNSRYFTTWSVLNKLSEDMFGIYGCSSAYNLKPIVR